MNAILNLFKLGLMLGIIYLFYPVLIISVLIAICYVVGKSFKPIFHQDLRHKWTCY